METIIDSSDKELLRKFIMSVGVVSNHGNWFTSENQNKELRVLAQSYDWLIFLTDNGLSQFIEAMLLRPISKYKFIRETFLGSYKEGKKKNQFTKVQMNKEADRLLQTYFTENLKQIEKWFNVISPAKKPLSVLKRELEILKEKDWKTILP